MGFLEMMNTAWALEYRINTMSRRDDRGIEWIAFQKMFQQLNYSILPFALQCY